MCVWMCVCLARGLRMVIDELLSACVCLARYVCGIGSYHRFRAMFFCVAYEGFGHVDICCFSREARYPCLFVSRKKVDRSRLVTTLMFRLFSLRNIVVAVCVWQV